MSINLRKFISSISQARIGQAFDDTAILADFTFFHTSTLTTTTTTTGTTTG